MAPHAELPDTREQGSGVVLTDPFIKGLKPTKAAREIWDAQQRGMLVRVLPSGKVQFEIRYRIQGKRRRLKLGVYSAVSLAEARIRARRAQSAIDDGKDPAGEQQAKKTAPTDTVDALVADYLKRHARPHKDTADGDERSLDVDVLPFWKGRSVKSLTRRDVRKLIDRVVDRGSPIAANRLLALVRKMLNFAVDHDWVESNVAARIPKPSPEKSRDRVLADDEIRRLWRCLTNPPDTSDKPAPGRPSKRREASDDPFCPVSVPVSEALRLQLLTAQRPGEVVGMRWADVDLDRAVWTIPGTDTKNGQTHSVPLSTQAVAIIKARLPKEGDSKKPIVFAGIGDAIADNAKKAPSRLSVALGFEMTRHDLRRTAATLMTRSGVPVAYVAKVLNHVDGAPRSTKVYDRHDYDHEKKIALDTLARTLTAILKAPAGSSTDKSAALPFVKKR